jgi:hypothetical protein
MLNVVFAFLPMVVVMAPMQTRIMNGSCPRQALCGHVQGEPPALGSLRVLFDCILNVVPLVKRGKLAHPSDIAERQPQSRSCVSPPNLKVSRYLTNDKAAAPDFLDPNILERH